MKIAVGALSLLLASLLQQAVAQTSEQDRYTLLYAKAILEFGQGHYGQAERHLRQALLAQPGDPDARYYLAQSLARRRQYAEAESLFRSLAVEEPASSRAWLGLGIVQYHRRSYQDAQPSLLAAERIAPDDPLVHYYLGLVHHELGEYDLSPDRFHRALTLSPDLAAIAHYYSGLAYFKRGLVDEARSALTSAAALEPDSEEGLAAKDVLAHLPPAEPAKPSPWNLSLSAGWEYDTNVVLMPAGTSPPGSSTGISRQSDYRSVLTGSLDVRGLQTAAWTVGASYGFYQSFHSKLSGFDVEDHAPTFYVERADGALRSRLQYLYDYALVGRSPYLIANGAQILLNWSPTARLATQIQLRYLNKEFQDGRFTLNSSRNGKNWLAGVMQSWFFSGTDGRAWVSYTFDKDATGGGSSSVAGSPNNLNNSDWAYNGHHVSTGLELPPIKTLELDLSFDWYVQQYVNPNSFSLDGVTRRRDNIYSVTAALSRDLRDNLTLQFQYTYNRDQNTIDVFDYNRSVYAFSLIGSF